MDPARRYRYLLFAIVMGTLGPRLPPQHPSPDPVTYEWLRLCGAARTRIVICLWAIVPGRLRLAGPAFLGFSVFHWINRRSPQP